jgi:hypothetical protein
MDPFVATAGAFVLPLAPTFGADNVPTKPTAAVTWLNFSSAQYAAFVQDLYGPQYQLVQLLGQFVNQATLFPNDASYSESFYPYSLLPWAGPDTDPNSLRNSANFGTAYAFLMLQNMTTGDQVQVLHKVGPWGMFQYPTVPADPVVQQSTNINAQNYTAAEKQGLGYARQPTQPFGLQLVPQSSV